MRQIILDFGKLDFTAQGVYLRIAGYVLLGVGGMGIGWFAQQLARKAQPGKSLMPSAFGVVFAAVALLWLGLSSGGPAGTAGGYALSFGLAFLFGVSVAAARPHRGQADEAGRIIRLERRLNLAVIVAVAGAAAMVLELMGYVFSPKIYGFGLMLVLGFALSIWLAQWRARRVGEDPRHITHCGILALVGGVVGSRAAYVIKYWDQFARDGLFEAINITSGGLIYFGGLILATAMVLIYLRARRLPMRRYLDIVAASLMLGLAFGRAGCMLNGCCYGSISRHDWPLGMSFPMYAEPLVKLDGRENPYSLGTNSPGPIYSEQLARNLVRPDKRLIKSDLNLSGLGPELIAPRDFDAEQIALAERTRSLPVKPAQALGIVNGLLLAGLLTVFYRLRRREGQVFAVFLIAYPVTRFILELIRATDPHDIVRGVFTHNQYTSMAMLAAGVIMMFWLRRLAPSAGPTWAQRAAGRAHGPAGTNRM